MRILISLYLLLISLCVGAQEPLKLRVMTYNLRFGELASLEELAYHIKAFKPDFVALQEVDCNTHRERAPKQNGKNFISELAYHTGMFGLYGKTIDYSGGYYGIGMLSRYPCVDMKKVMLPNPSKSEQRAVMYATYEVGTDTLVFAVTHLDISGKDARREQAEFIVQELQKCNYPVLIGGDFNAGPTEPAIEKVMEKWGRNMTIMDQTYSSTTPKIKIDYIYAYPKNRWEVKTSQTVRSYLSDHFPIVSEIILKR